MPRDIVKRIKEKTMITKRRILKEKLTITSFKLIIILLLLITVTYAWFVKNEKADVSLVTTKVNQIVELEVSLDNGKTWTKDATLDIGKDYTFNSEITSNGMNMYKANLKSSDGTPISFKTARKNEDYLEFKVLLKSSTHSKVYLEKKSKVIPNSGENKENLIGENALNKSLEGNFSKDLIAGAVRVAFIENDNISGNYIEKNMVNLLWAPNKNYELKIDENEKISFDIESENTQNYNYIKVTSQNVYEEARVENLRDEINISFENKEVGNELCIAEIKNESENETENIKAVTVRVWVEGNDREAVAALKGGLFNITLSFIGIAIEE